MMDAIPSTLMKLDLKSVMKHQKNQKTKKKKIPPVEEAKKRRPPAPATMIAQKKSFAWQDHVPRLDPVPSTRIASIPPTTFHASVVLGTCIAIEKLGRVEWSVPRMEPLASQKSEKSTALWTPARLATVQMQCRVPATTAVVAMPFTLTLLGIPFAKEKKEKKVLEVAGRRRSLFLYVLLFILYDTIPYFKRQGKCKLSNPVIVREAFELNNQEKKRKREGSEEGRIVRCIPNRSLNTLLVLKLVWRIFRHCRSQDFRFPFTKHHKTI